jgi:predicted ATPase with chaperone activity
MREQIADHSPQSSRVAFPELLDPPDALLFASSGSPLGEDPIVEFPLMPTSLKETGLNIKLVTALLVKSIHMLGLETNVEIAAHLKLSQVLVDDLLSRLKQQGLIEIRAIKGSDSRVARYSLTDAAKDMAVEAARLCEYAGPAPVPLAQYQMQVKKQSLTNERISIEELTLCLSHLTLPERIIRKLGPAINSGRSLLIYGPPGNGKTSISEAVGQILQQPVYIPYCIEVDGQIIRIFDQTVHSPIAPQGENGQGYKDLLKKRPDPRWVKCRRPVIITGGELTLEMLDLEYDATARFYEAPPQMKAVGGIFIIDDFGRQLVQPRDLLNRWIIPLEKRVDYLAIHTGKKFDVPFDELVIFSTNIPPEQLMDPGLLRRVKYKIRIEPPSVNDFITIFRRVCKQFRLHLSEELLAYLLEDYYPRNGLKCAAFHPIFIVEHAIASCKYQGLEPRLTLELLEDALENLYVTKSDDENFTISAIRGTAPSSAKRTASPS